MKDFFTRYRETRKHQYILPAIFGIMFAFAIVVQITNTQIDLRSLQANVLEAGTQKVVYEADIIMERMNGDLSFRIGKSAQNIETLSFSLLGDPNVLKGLTTSFENTTIQSNEPGIFLIKIALGKSVNAGDILTILTPKLEGASSLALIDAGFTSSGVTYSLSTKGE